MKVLHALAFLCIAVSANAQVTRNEVQRLAPLHRASDLGYSSSNNNYSIAFDSNTGSANSLGIGRNLFGLNLSIAGNKLIVASPGISSAFLYERDITTGLWTYDEVLHFLGPVGSFGTDVAIDSDRFIIGAPDYSVFQGGRFVHGLSFFANLSDLEHKIFRQDAPDGDTSVSIGHPQLLLTGDHFMIGDPGNGSDFGHAVDMLDTLAIVGGPLETDDAGDPSGNAYIYDYSVTANRLENAPSAAIELSPSPSSQLQDGGQYGYSVALANGRAIVGWPGFDSSPNNNIGRAIVFEKQSNGTWSQVATLEGSGTANPRFGSALDIDDTHIVVGQPGVRDPSDPSATQEGRVFIYDATSRALLQTIAPPTTARRFGASVAIDSNRLVIGAPGDGGSIPAAAFSYTLGANGLWTHSSTLLPSTPEAASEFGSSVAISGEVVAVGAARESADGNEAGAVYLFQAEPLSQPATITLNNLVVTYNGSPHPLTPSTTPAGLAVTLSYGGSPNAPSDAGQYTVTATLNEPGYAATPVDATLTINKASETLNLSAIPALMLGGSAETVMAYTDLGLRDDDIVIAIADSTIASLALPPNAAPTVAPVKTGATQITASLPDNPNFNPVAPVSVAVIVDSDQAPASQGEAKADAPPTASSSKKLGYRVAISGKHAAASTREGVFSEIVTYRQFSNGSWLPTQTLGTGELVLVEDLAMGSDILVAGMPASNAAAIYIRRDTSWQPLETLTGGNSESAYGRTVGVSQDGQFIYISFYNHKGDPQSLGGARVRVYKRSGDSFSLHQTLVGGIADQVSFGHAFAEEAGRLLVAGNEGNAGAGILTVYDLDEQSGLYEQVDARSPIFAFGSRPLLGSDIALLDGKIIAGVPGIYVDDTGTVVTPADPNAADKGAISFINVDGEGFQSIILDSSIGLPGDQAGHFGFGADFAVTENGDILATSFTDAGSYEDSHFHLIQKGPNGYTVKALPDPAGFALNQDALSGGGELSADGATAMVGAYLEDSPTVDSGAVYFYDLQARQLLGPEQLTPLAPGNSMQAIVACHGPSFAVGFPDDSESATNAGKVLLYQTAEGIGSPRQILTAPTPAADHRFGAALEMTQNFLLVGAPGANQVHIYQTELDGSYSFKQTIDAPAGFTANDFGSLIAAEQTSVRRAIAIASPSEAKVYVYILNGVSTFWELHETIEGNPANHFAKSIDINEEFIAIGAPETNSGIGRVILRQWDDTFDSYAAETVAIASDFQQDPNKPIYSSKKYGSSVALGRDYLAAMGEATGLVSLVYIHDIGSDGFTSGVKTFLVQNSDRTALDASGDSIIVGAAQESITATQSGRVEIFKRDLSGWSQQKALNGSSAQERLGVSVAICENYAIAGAVYQQSANRSAFAFLPGTASTFASWIAQYNLSGSRGSPNADPNGDGIPNLLAYALGISPIANNSELNLRPTVSPNGGSAPTTTFRIPVNPPADITLRLESSTNLVNWTTIAESSSGSPLTIVAPSVTPTADGSALRFSFESAGVYYRLFVELATL
ncbi:MBG domain-containing protein [Pelagicoccus enzymogenes]|uniref:MBG domain-containing protein n=1 Tax=Pelagicoccus enzymogenes TaxID=2773457 RepID=UPI00280F6008|nr:MBG domain-containing protein [Pelagicoccus enzymogenes]MDQ8200373.1 MBG domain-containing protein [Pelagicoccus enzymogenes]